MSTQKKIQDIAARLSAKIDEVEPSDLSDPKVDASVGRKYSYLLNKAYLNEVSMAYTTLVYALTSDELLDSTKTVPSFASTSQIDMAPIGASDRYTNRLRVSEKDGLVEVFYDFPKITLSATNIGTRQDPSEIKRVNSVLKALLGKNLPTSMGRKAEFTVDTYVTLAQLAAINFGSHVRGNEIVYAPSDSEFKKYSGSIRFHLMADTIERVGAIDDNETEVESGVLRAEINVVCTLVLPYSYALWATSAANADEFSMSEFLEHVNGRCAYHFPTSKDKKPAKPPERRASVQSFLRRMSFSVRHAAESGVSRASKDGFSILGDGTLAWIPQSSAKMDLFLKEESDRYNPDTMTLHQLPESSPAKDVVLSISWKNDALVYANRSGHPTLVDLKGARALDDTSIGFLLRRDLKDSQEFAQIIAVYSQYGKQNLHMELPDPSDPKRSAPAVDALQRALSKVGSVTIRSFIDEEITDNLGNPLRSVQATLRAFGEDLTKMYEQFDSFNMPLSIQIAVKPMFHAIAVYAKKDVADTYINKAKEALASNNAAVPIPERTTLVGLPGISHLMPHQPGVIAQMQSNPDGANGGNVVIGVAGGGGKTILQLADITYQMQKGRWKRPLLIMPQNLVRQFVNQINTFSKGELRPFVLDSVVWWSWINAGLSTKQVANIIRKQPANTLFITNYDFLKKNSKDIQLGKSSSTVYPIVKFLAGLHIDAVLEDESHKAKNLGSQVAELSRTLGAEVTSVRLSSGTVVSNTPTDLLGQMAIINPIALGNSMDRYIDEDTRRIRNSSLPIINQSIRTFTKHVSVRNSEWSFLLPQTKSHIHRVVMTPKQREFYDRILNDQLMKIREDKKLAKMLESNDPNDDDRIAAILRKHLTRLEVFLSAPDAPPPTGYGEVFKSLEGVGPDDLVSSKVLLMDKIIDSHFNGGKVVTINENGDEVEQEMTPDTNKILVFSFNIDIGDHIMRHSKHTAKMVRFKAGDDDAIVRFINDPNVKILVASENTIKEGHNLQVASRIIRMQGVWTPGEIDQALWRIVRPDVPDASGKQKYNRTSIHLDWIATDNSIDVAKMGRLLWKLVEKSRIEDSTKPSFQAWSNANQDLIESTTRLSMNLDTIESYSTFDSLQNHFKLFNAFEKWNEAEFFTSRKRLKEKLELKLGRPVKDEEVISLAMVPVEHEALKVGDKHGIFGGYFGTPQKVVPYDPYGLSLMSLAEAIDDNDDDSEEDGDDSESAIIELEGVGEGDTVITQWGLGVISRSRKNSAFAYVRIPGLSSEPIKIRKTMLWIPKDPVNRKALERVLLSAGKNGVVSVNLKEDDDESVVVRPWLTKEALKSAQEAVLKSKPSPKPAKFTETTEEDEDEGDAKAAGSKSKDNKKKAAQGKAPVDVSSSVIYGQPSLFVFKDDLEEDDQELLAKRGWFEIGKSVQATVYTPQGLRELIDYFKREFVVQPAYLRQLEAILALFKQGKNSVRKIMTADTTAFRDFIIRNTRPVKDKENEIIPIAIVENDALVVLINGKTSPAARKLVNKRPVPSIVSKFEKNDAIYVFIGTKAKVRSEIENIAKKGVVIGNRRELDKKFK